MDAAIQILAESKGAFILAVAILIVALLAYHLWFSRSVNGVLNGLKRLTGAISGTGNRDWEVVRERVDRLMPGQKALVGVWHETQGRVSSIIVGDRTVTVMFGSPRDLWNARGVLSREFNLDLAEVIPNLLVGIGLFFTFVFLALALTSTTAALTDAVPLSELASPEISPLEKIPAGASSIDPSAGYASLAESSSSVALDALAESVKPEGNSGQPAEAPPPAALPSAPSVAEIEAEAARAASQNAEAAIRDLLKVAGAKFLTSLAGLLASLVWMYFAKQAINRVEIACDDLLAALAEVVPTNGGEKLVEQQLALGQSSLKLVEKQLETGRSSLQKAEEGLEQNSELLIEAREQTGALKRFETDLALSLASAINPQMQTMTDRLVGAIDNLSQRLSSMNQDALEKMLADFSGMIRDATKTEMTEMKEALTSLSGKLNSAGETIGENAAVAVNVLNAATDAILVQSKEVASSLAMGANSLEQATSSLRQAITELDGTVVEAKNSGREGISVARTVIDQTGEAVQRLATVSSGLADAATAMEAVGGKIAGIMEDVEELSREQRAVVVAVREVTPQASAAVERVSSVLDQAAKQTLSMMQQTRQSMDGTATALGKTVSSITEGVTVYTKQIAELHRTMDSHMARAVGSLDKGIGNLAESVEELSEVMESSIKRAG